MESFADFETEDCEIDVTFGLVYEGSPVIVGGLNATEINPINVSYTSRSLEVT